MGKKNYYSNVYKYYFQWQQTEDFSRKKEIRTHMYKLREERLRNLYSPEPGAEVKGPCLFQIFSFNTYILT